MPYPRWTFKVSYLFLDSSLDLNLSLSARPADRPFCAAPVRRASREGARHDLRAREGGLRGRQAQLTAARNGAKTTAAVRRIAQAGSDASAVAAGKQLKVLRRQVEHALKGESPLRKAADELNTGGRWVASRRSLACAAAVEGRSETRAEVDAPTTCRQKPNFVRGKRFGSSPERVAIRVGARRYREPRNAPAAASYARKRTIVDARPFVKWPPVLAQRVRTRY